MSVTAKLVFSEISAGIIDALRLDRCWQCWVHSVAFRSRLRDAILLNLVFVIGSVLLLDSGLLPLVDAFGSSLGLGLGLGLGESASESVSARSLVRSLLALVYNVLWLWPLYIFSILINTFWYHDIAKAVLLYRAGTPKLVARNRIDGFKLIAGELYRMLMGALYVLQLSLFRALPLVGGALWIAGLAWLYALYSFEYAWSMSGGHFTARMDKFASTYLYRLGFGLPLAVVFSLSGSGILRDAVFAVLFPFCIAMATLAPDRSRIDFNITVPSGRTGLESDLLIPSPLESKNATPDSRKHVIPLRLQPFRLSYAWTTLVINYIGKPVYLSVVRNGRRIWNTLYKKK